MRSLNWKLAGALLLVVVISVVLMAVLIDQSTAYHFGRYVSGMMGNMGGMMGGPGPNSPAAQAEFLSTVNRSLWIAGLAAVAVALVAGILLTRQIVRPIRALTAGARQISAGNLAYRVEAKSNDEVGELVQSFNTMAANLSQSEQVKRRMTADIAHELRTPLAVIEGTVDGMLDGVFPCDRERLFSVKEQTALLTRLIGDLRDLTLAEAGQLKLQLAEEDVVELMRRSRAQLAAEATERGLELRLDAPEEVLPVMVDRVRLEQIVSNLVTNAIRHTPRGGAIAISVKRASGRGVLIAVSDTGEGISAEHLPHVFERFYRVSDARARSDGGTGLGLAIVKSLVQAHGGKVWAESQPGRGSTFFVELPGR
jgi:two-component system OmpR family sensor kinase/two-component system sensor histidine kinase BaeS